jgi:hypothetical protein
MKHEIEYAPSGEIIVPAGFMLVQAKNRTRNGITETIPAHLRKLRGPKGITEKADAMFSTAMHYNLENKILSEGPESRIIAEKLIRGIKAEIDWMLDRLLKSL